MRRFIATAGVALLCSFLPVIPAHAAPPQRLAPVLLVLDASGSMTAMSGSETKMAAAKKAIHAVVGESPANARMGLEVYGTHTGSSDAEKAKGCQDTDVVHPVGPLDRTGLIKAADSVRPRGYTPIGRALRVAVQALPSSGPRSVVLVSDGVDTCAPPDPCAVARELAKKAPELRIHTVGFQVDSKARAQLLCIAQASGGSYTDAPKAGDLGPVLSRVTGQALRNYQPAGTPVTGATDRDRAPVLAPGSYLDTLGTESRQYYAVSVPAGATAYFGATAVYSRVRSTNQTLHMRMKGPDGTDCRTADDDSGSRSGDSTPLTAALSWGAGTSGSVPGCRGAGRYTFQVWRNSHGSDEVPLELYVGVQPPVSGSSGPAPASAPVRLANSSGAVRKVSGGGSFGSAATLVGSGTYSDTLQPGEFVFYRVHLSWGQGLASQVRYAAGNATVSAVNSAVYTPFRKRIASADGTYIGHAMMLPSHGSFATLPIRYRNRESTDPARKAESLDGWYYLSAQLARGTKPGGGAVPVRLSVSVVGTPEPGPRTGPRPSASTAAPSSPSTSGTATASSAVPSQSAGPSSPAAVAAHTATDGSGSSRWWIPVVIVVLVLAAAGTVLAVRRRQRPTAG